MQKSSKEKYPATQAMRRLESEIRRLKDEQKAYTAAGNELDAMRTQREINKKQKDYTALCNKYGLAPKPKRTEVEGYKKISVAGLQNLENRDILKEKIKKGEISLIINPEMQNRHILGTKEYIPGRSYITISTEELQNIVNSKYATGTVTLYKNGQIKEILFSDKTIGFDVDENGIAIETNGLKIHYSKNRTHVVPFRKRFEEDEII